MKTFLKAILFLIVIAAAAIISSGWFGMQYWNRGNGHSKSTLITVKRGTGFNQIVNDLAQQNLIQQPHAFKLIERARQFQGTGGTYKAGEYLIPPNARPVQISQILTKGKPFQRTVQLVEGTTVQTFMAKNATLPGLIGAWPPVAEGSLLPDTYAYSSGSTKTELIQRMQKAMQQAVLEAWATRASNLPLKNPAEAVILASIVEKETAVASERPLVASVFHNRLKRGMRLQSDPTIIYGIDKSGTLTKDGAPRPIYKSDIKTPTAYNTYTIDRLPPTAICNPSLASIKAVLNPAESNYLFFVADGSGGHAFSKSLDEHNSNVVNWRKLEKLKNVQDAEESTPSITLPSPADLVLPVE